MISTVEKEYDRFGFCSYKVTYANNEVVHVPHNEENRHYQAIQEWVAEGNTIIDNGGE